MEGESHSSGCSKIDLVILKMASFFSKSVGVAGTLSLPLIWVAMARLDCKCLGSGNPIQVPMCYCILLPSVRLPMRYRLLFPSIRSWLVQCIDGMYNAFVPCLWMIMPYLAYNMFGCSIWPSSDYNRVQHLPHSIMVVWIFCFL